VKYPSPVVVSITPKHGLADCVVAAMSAYLEKPYEEVVAAAGKAYPNFWKIGLENKHAATIARRLKTPVRWVRDYDIDEDSGVLSINYIVGLKEHVVLLLDGHIYELEDKPINRWDPTAYLSVHGAKPGALMVRREFR
jgi:hypothetical protein